MKLFLLIVLFLRSLMPIAVLVIRTLKSPGELFTLEGGLCASELMMGLAPVMTEDDS
jgi:hypothetical protein